MKTLFLGLLICTTFAQAAELAISSTHSLDLSSSEWQKGQGQFFRGAPPLKMYSNLKSSSHQIFVEDVFVPTKQLKNRLPSECMHLAHHSFNTFCKAPQKAGTADTEAVSLTGLFKTDSPNVTQVRTLYVTGKKAEVLNLLASISTNKPTKTSRK